MRNPPRGKPYTNFSDHPVGVVRLRLVSRNNSLGNCPTWNYLTSLQQSALNHILRVACKKNHQIQDCLFKSPDNPFSFPTPDKLAAKTVLHQAFCNPKGIPPVDKPSPNTAKKQPQCTKTHQNHDTTKDPSLGSSIPKLHCVTATFPRTGTQNTAPPRLIQSQSRHTSFNTPKQSLQNSPPHQASHSPLLSSSSSLVLSTVATNSHPHQSLTQKLFNNTAI